MNIDAAFDSHSCTGSAGVVIRNHLGRVQSAAVRWYDDVPDALTAEAMAAKEGLELVVENYHDRVILEVDCQNLKTLLDDHSGLSPPLVVCVMIVRLISTGQLGP